jgi:hypothetical protein
MLETEFGGMQEVLTALYATTGEAEHLRLARLFDHRAVFDPLARGADPLDGLHANTQIPKAIGAALDCDLTGEPRYCAVAQTFWRRVALFRSYAIGGHSEDEHFPPVTHLSRHLGESTAETCNTYNMLKLSRQLFLRDADPLRAEFYERGLLNHILASNDPATGRVTYYVSMKPGAWRTYSTADDSFWCCVGTGMENPARFGEAVYFRRGDALLVTLFLASELRWPEKGLVLRQETRFPEEEGTRLVLRLERPARFPLELRRPAWLAGALEARVNGEPQALPGGSGARAVLEREWRDGDVVTVRLPMGTRFEPMPDDPTVGAFLHGPVVLAADLGTGGLDAAARYGPLAPEFHEAPPELPTVVAAGPAQALSGLRPAGEPLSFRLEVAGPTGDVVLRPFYRLFDRRHSVYFRVTTPSAYAARAGRERAGAEARRALDARTVDSVTAGSPADEARRGLEESRSDAWWLEGRPCRSARGDASFSYRLAVPRDGPAVLRATYWGGETRRHRFEVLVEGEAIATQALFDDRPGEFLDVEYPVPERLTRGRESVRFGFRPVAGGSTGAVFEVRVVRPAATTP